MAVMAAPAIIWPYSEVYAPCNVRRPGGSVNNWRSFRISRGHRKSFHAPRTVSYTHLRAHETVLDLVCRLLLEKKQKIQKKKKKMIKKKKKKDNRYRRLRSHSSQSRQIRNHYSA